MKIATFIPRHGGYGSSAFNVITTYRNLSNDSYLTEDVIYAYMHLGIVHFAGRNKPWMLWENFNIIALSQSRAPEEKLKFVAVSK